MFQPVLAEAIARTNWHFAAAILLGVLSLLVLVVIVVEVAVWRRFRELKTMFATALNIDRSYDIVFAGLRKVDESSSDRIDALTGRVKVVEEELHRLSTYHPRGAAHEGPG